MQSPTPWTENQFGSIYNNYFPILFRFTLKHSKDATLSKDLAQECLIKLWQDNFMPNATQKHLKGLLFGFSFWYTSVGLSFFKSLRLILPFMQDPFIFKPITFLKQNLTSN